MLYRGYKVELAPTRKQISLLKMHAGTARFAYNWGLGQRQDTYKQNGTVLDAIQLHKLLNAKKQDGTFGWMYKTSKCAPQEALRDLDRSFNNYFAYLKKSRQVSLHQKLDILNSRRRENLKTVFDLQAPLNFIWMETINANKQEETKTTSILLIANKYFPLHECIYLF